MKKIITNRLLLLMLLLVIVGVCWAAWRHLLKEKEFECWARVHTRSSVDHCQRSGFSDVFFSFHGNGEGYFLADGTSSCQNEPPEPVAGLINFNYKKQGDYYSIHMAEKNAALSRAFTMLNYNNIKLKITQLNSADFILTLPNETLMVCTED